MKLISYGSYKEGNLTVITATDGENTVEWATKGELTPDDAIITRMKLTAQLANYEEINYVPR